jgi:transcriptional regulator with XRE-family HTH domain
MERYVASALYDLVDRERALKGWSWTMLEERSGVSRSTVGKWRTRAGPPQAGTVVAVADALGIDRLLALRLGGVLYTGEPEDMPPGLRKMLDALPEDEREWALARMQGIPVSEPGEDAAAGDQPADG